MRLALRHELAAGRVWTHIAAQHRAIAAHGQHMQELAERGYSREELTD